MSARQASPGPTAEEQRGVRGDEANRGGEPLAVERLAIGGPQRRSGRSCGPAVCRAEARGGEPSSDDTASQRSCWPNACRQTTSRAARRRVGIRWGRELTGRAEWRQGQQVELRQRVEVRPRVEVRQRVEARRRLEPRQRSELRQRVERKSNARLAAVSRRRPAVSAGKRNRAAPARLDWLLRHCWPRRPATSPHALSVSLSITRESNILSPSCPPRRG